MNILLNIPIISHLGWLVVQFLIEQIPIVVGYKIVGSITRTYGDYFFDASITSSLNLLLIYIYTPFVVVIQTSVISNFCKLIPQLSPIIVSEFHIYLQFSLVNPPLMLNSWLIPGLLMLIHVHFPFLQIHHLVFSRSIPHLLTEKTRVFHG